MARAGPTRARLELTTDVVAPRPLVLSTRMARGQVLHPGCPRPWYLRPTRAGSAVSRERDRTTVIARAGGRRTVPEYAGISTWGIAPRCRSRALAIVSKPV
jgi:hypothetical protein